MLWSHDETNLLKEFLHVDRLGGSFIGPEEAATWEKIAATMNIVGTTRNISRRTYTARDAAWQYISMIWPLLNAENPNSNKDPFQWTLDEDDLLLHYLPSRYPGGRFEDTTGNVTFAKVSESMNAIGPMFGFNWRLYKYSNVADHYKKVIYPRLTGHAFRRKIYTWQADETELLLGYTNVKQGGYLEGDEVLLQDVADKMNEDAKIRKWAYRQYTSEGLRNRLHRVRQDRVATGQLSGPYRISGSTDLPPIAEELSDPENLAFSEDEMDTTEG